MPKHDWSALRSAIDAVIPKDAPKEAPLCLACRKKLRPNYDVKTLPSIKTRRAYTYIGDYGRRYDYSEEFSDTKQDETGRWYRDVPVRRVERKWRGTWGRYGDGFFCGLTCAHRWALAVARKLEADGEQLVLKPNKPAESPRKKGRK